MPREELHTTLQELQLELDKVHFDNEANRENANQSLTLLEEKA